jgi:SNF2 family DNA or RNA helicase
MIPNVGYYSTALETTLDEMYVEHEDSLRKNMVALNRVTDNIKEQECQICLLPLEDVDAFIVKCCGIILCDRCGIRGNNIAKKYDAKSGKSTLVGTCANCEATIYPASDLIFVNKDINLDEMLNTKLSDVGAEDTKPEPISEAPKRHQEIKNPKLRALLNIIEGETPEETTRLGRVKIANLLEGTVDIPAVKETERKVLIFANFNETLATIEQFLVQHNIEFLRLGGTFKEMAETIRKFSTQGKVLIINSQQHCAGLNIQFATDLVFFHKMIDPNVEAQISGRAQRIGRTCNLKLWFLCYQNEEILLNLQNK